MLFRSNVYEIFVRSRYSGKIHSRQIRPALILPRNVDRSPTPRRLLVKFFVIVGTGSRTDSNSTVDHEEGGQNTGRIGGGRRSLTPERRRHRQDNTTATATLATTRCNANDENYGKRSSPTKASPGQRTRRPRQTNNTISEGLACADGKLALMSRRLQRPRRCEANEEVEGGATNRGGIEMLGVGSGSAERGQSRRVTSSVSLATFTLQDTADSEKKSILRGRREKGDVLDR